MTYSLDLVQCVILCEPGFLQECERIVIYLILEDVLHPKVVYTAYNTIVYLVLGPNGPKLLASTNPRAEISFPIRPQRKQAAPSRKSSTNLLAIADEDGWISATSMPTKVKPAKAKSGKAKTAKTKATIGKTAGKSKVKEGSKKASKKTPTIVEIPSSSSSDSDSDDIVLAKRHASIKKNKKVIDDVETSDGSDSDFTE